MIDFPIFSVNDLIGTIRISAMHCCQQHGSIDRSAVPAEKAFPRSATGLEVIDTVIEHGQLNIEKAVFLEKTLEDIQEHFHDFGLYVRHLDLRLQQPLDKFCTQINSMAYRNLQLQTNITRETIKEWAREGFFVELSDEDFSSAEAFRQRFTDGDEDEPVRTFDTISDFCTSYGLFFSEDEISVLNRKRSMDKVLEMLNTKLHARTPNDGMVQYGNCWLRHNYEQSRELYYETLGGVNNAAKRIPLKHISDLFEVAGSRHGILTRVPKDQRTGRISEAPAPVRAYLRTANLSIKDYGYPPAMIADELKILRESDEAVYFDYYEFEELLDDGWVVD